MKGLYTSSIFILLGLALANPSGAQTANPAQSSLSIVLHEMGVPVEAQFKTFAASIDFDEKHPSLAHVEFTVDMASFALPDPDYTQEALGPEWFDAAHYPKASFVSTTVTPVAPGKLEVKGKLTIKGNSADVNVPVSYRHEGTAQTYDGALVVQRLKFAIGAGEWKDTSVLANDVSIKIHATIPDKT